MVKRRAKFPLWIILVGLILFLFVVASFVSSPRSLMPSVPGAYSLGEPSNRPVDYTSIQNAALIVTAGPSGGGDDQTQARIVLRNAVLNLIVEDPSKSVSDITKLADEFKGWVVTSETHKITSSGNSYPQATITIRVPAERLNEAMDRIKGAAISVESENTTGQDVTQQYTDLKSKLTNLEAAETQLRKIMDSAAATKDVLSVYDELVRVRGDIEVTKGQIKFYDESAAFSSINITLYVKQDASVAQVHGWNPLQTLNGAVNFLINTLQVFADIVIWGVVYLLPIGLLIGVPGVFIWRRTKRFRPPAQTPLPAEGQSDVQA